MRVRNARRRRPSKSKTPNQKIVLCRGFYLNLSARQVQIFVTGGFFFFDPPDCQVPYV